MIEFDNLTFIYDNKPLMQHFTCCIARGEKAVLYGPSGHGKSTLLASVPGFVRPDEGTIRIDGRTLDASTVQQVRRRIAWLPQEFTLEFMDQRGPEALFKDIEIPSFIDSETKTCTFDSDQFIQYLERTKSIPSNRSPGEVVSLSGGNILEVFSQSNSEAATSLLMRDSPYLSNLLDLTSIPENCAGPFVLSSTSGDTAFFADLTMVVPKSCTDPELAWDFLKFCVSPVEVPAYATAYHPEGSVDLVWGSLPMSRENMERYSQLYGKIERIYRESSTLPAGFDPASFDDPFSQEFLEKFDQAVSSLNFAVNDIAPMESIYNSILKTYYGTNTLSAQECARQIQDRVEIWLNE